MSGRRRATPAPADLAAEVLHAEQRLRDARAELDAANRYHRQTLREAIAAVRAGEPGGGAAGKATVAAGERASKAAWTVAALELLVEGARRRLSITTVRTGTAGRTPPPPGGTKP